MLEVRGCKSKGSPKATVNSTRVEGILISGGHGAETATDLYIGNNKTCSLPALPDQRWDHTMGVVEGMPVICGGTKQQYSIDSVTPHTCLRFTSSSTAGVWTDYFTMSCPRTQPTSWVSKEGLVVFGGGNCFGAEIVPSGGGFGFSGSNKRYSCNIDDTSSTIITGGLNSLDVIERYSSTGKEETLPKLNTGRWAHGCGSYKGSGGSMVLIVAGGADKAYKALSSTESIVVGEKAWSMVKPLPYVLERMGSISMLNNVFFIGGRTDDGKWPVASGKILEFDGKDWKETGQLPVARDSHAVAKVDVANFLGFCK